MTDRPGPASVTLPGAIREAIVAHARAEIPNEACGLIIGDRPAADGGRALRWIPATNEAASPFRYVIDPDVLYRLLVEMDTTDEVFWAIVHSHTHSPAAPSPTDLRQAFYPESLYLLVSLDPAEADSGTGRESVRAWRILDGVSYEVEVEVESDPPA